MKKLVTLILAVAIILSCAVAVSAKTPAVFLYVATDGNDSNCGSLKSPFKTLSAALTYARNIKETTVINIRGGVYQMTSTLNLTKNDTDLVIRAYKDEDVTITGGSELPMSAFTKCTDTEFLNALSDQSVRDKILWTKPSEFGITNLGSIQVQGFYHGNSQYTPMLSFNDKALKLAGYPNEGYMYTENVIVSSGSYHNQYRMNENEFTVTDKRYLNWKSKDIWALGYYNHDWADATAPASITSNGTIKAYTNMGTVSNRRVRFFNVPEEIDIPGEYYIDRNTGMMYLYPTDEMKSYSKLYFTSYNQRFVKAYQSKNVTFSGIRFNGTCYGGFYIQNCDGFVIDNCEFTNIGDAAVYFLKCYNSGVRNSYLHDLSSWGVYMNQCGDRVTQTPGNCFVTNCHIETFSQYRRTYSPGIHLENVVDVKILNNEIHDAPHFAIRYEGNDITFMYNDFSDVCQDTSDTGAVYTGRRYDTFGNVIKYNYFHDMTAIDTTTGMKTQAVYLDDMSAGTEVFGNVFYNVDAVALYGGGSYNTFCNNIMIDCPQPLWFDARGINWGWGDSEQWAALSGINYTSGIWAEKYPQLQVLLSNSPKTPQNNLLENNIYYNTPDFRIDSPVEQKSTIRNNVRIVGTNSFADYKNKNFTVLKDSEIYKKCPEFQNIPFNSIGRYAYSVKEDYEPLPYRCHTAKDYLTVSETENGYAVSNRDKTPFYLAIITPVYNIKNGVKSLASASISFKTVDKNANITANKDDIIVSTDNLEPIK